MHETHLAERILSSAAARTREAGLSTVKRVRLRVGAWTHIAPDSLIAALQAAAARNGLGEIEVEIEMARPECRCEDCGAMFQPEGATLRCACCGSARVLLQQQEDTELLSVEG